MRVSSIFRVLFLISASGFVSLPLATPAQTGSLTVQSGTTALPPLTLVNHSQDWRFHLGTNAPPAGWQTNAEATLDASWPSGPGGLGYADGDDATDLQSVMRNRTTTLYIRQTFGVADVLDPARRLELIMDYDDGFVAYLDGVEVARSANVPGTPGTEPAHTATTLAGRNHEASSGNPANANPPETFDLGLEGGRLAPGDHVLAILGLNAGLSSSDFSLIADLQLTGGQNVASGGAFFTLVPSNAVVLIGSNTVAGSTRVVVNGQDAEFDSGTSQWSLLQTLEPGVNPIFIAAVAANGQILAATNRLVISETAARSVGGAITADTSWTSAGGIVRVTNDVTVAGGATLTIDPGVVVLLASGAGIQAQANSRVLAVGSRAQPVYFLPADGNTSWQELAADGVDASLQLQFAEVVAGQVMARNAASATLEDCVLRHYHVGSRLFISATDAAQLTLRRCAVRDYDQCRFAGTPVLIEDCLFEDVSSDATDFADSANIQVRRTTYRFGSGSGTDAIDLGNNPGMLVDGCLIHDFPDKGVSIADQSNGTVVQNSLIYNNAFGISAYASSDCVFNQNTLAANTSGLALYVRSGRPGPGTGAGTNNIIWGNVTNVHLADGGALTLAFSDVEGTNWPGPSNLSVAPLFVDAAAHDYRLQEQSLAKFAGNNDLDMGVLFPVGGLPPAPFNLAAYADGTNLVQLWWEEDADNEAGFLIERSMDKVAWSPLASVPPATTAYTDATADLDQFYYYRVQATNASGMSRYSNVAGARREPPVFVVGGTMTDDNTWFPALGTVLVTSTVTVPADMRLTIEAGVKVRIVNGAGIAATGGGIIEVAGTEESPVYFQTAEDTGIWDGLSATGDGSALIVRHADIKAGPVNALDGASMLLEDCYIHEYKNGSARIAGCQNAAPVTVRRCHFSVYHETLWRFTLMLIEDSLFENADDVSSDALDFDGALAGSVIRRCTFRHGPQSNTDAIDLGSSTQAMLVEDCLMYDFPNDKGISIGETTFGIAIRNCLMYGVDSGVAVKDDCTAIINNCTIVNSQFGFRNYNKRNSSSPTGGGHITNSWDNILWNNTDNISLRNGSTLTADHSDFQGVIWPGVGNIDADPLFRDPANNDFRLTAGSPCVGTGRNGGNMGAHYPVGAPMAPSHPSIQSVAIDGATATIVFWADSEKTYTLEATTDPIAGTWQTVANVPSPALPRLMRIEDGVIAGGRFYRLSTP